MDIEELTHLIETQGKDVYGFCYKLTRDKHQADDLYQRISLYMYYTTGMTVEEIDSSLKIPSGTVKSRLHRTRNLAVYLKKVKLDFLILALFSQEI